MDFGLGNQSTAVAVLGDFSDNRKKPERLRRLIYSLTNLADILRAVVARPLARSSWGVLLNLPSLRVIVPNKIYRSGEPRNKTHFKQVASLGIRTLVCVKKAPRTVFSRSTAAALGLRCLRYDIGPDFGFDVRAVRACVESILDPANQPVLVHCGGGRHRAGVINAAIRIHQGWSARAAILEYAARARPIPFQDNIDFIERYARAFAARPAG